MPKKSVTFKLSVLSISISSTLILSSALAAGGSPGADGQNVAYGGYSQSAASAGGDGSNGLDIAQHNLSNNDINTQASTPGGDSTSANGGGDGGGQIGGQGGGSVFGGASIGGAGGSDRFTSSTSVSTNGGSGGAVSDNTITLTNVTLTGASGGGGSTGGGNGGGGGGGGQGGGSIFGGFSNGGAGGYGASSISPSVSTNGGDGGAVYGNTIALTSVILVGATGGSGVQNAFRGGNAFGGQGGGSVFGGLSIGGTAGTSFNGLSLSYSNGGNGGAISGNTITLTDVTLMGATGGAGSDGGQGGGSVFGGASLGGRGGKSQAQSNTANTFSNGGNGGAVYGNTITLTDVTLTGADGGVGGVQPLPGGASGGASGGHGGGSVFGGLSSGGAGGTTVAFTNGFTNGSSNGGDGGTVSSNTIILNNVTLIGGTGGTGGISRPLAGDGSDGLKGGSVFGGLSNGGAGGYSIVASSGSPSANGGNGGAVSGNAITLSGKSSLTGDIYGGYSRGGTAGQTSNNGGITFDPGTTGSGGVVENNTVTLIGADLTIGGSVYGGYSVDGDGTVHNTRAFTGNTLNLIGYRGSLVGIYNFEKYNWVLPKDVVNNDTLIKITGSDKVSLYDTQHTVALENDGNRLNAGDTVTLIDKAGGSTALTTLTNKEVKQGHFIVYDASLSTSTGALVLRIDGKQDNTPAGRINPTSKAFLEGRAASLAFNNQGADLVSDYGINSAHFSLEQLKKDGSDLNLTPFLAVNGGSSRYSTGSHIDVRGSNMIFGVATGLEFKDQSAMTLGLFVEHGDGSYNSYNSFSNDGSVHGKGNVRYTGGGALFHINVAGTSRNKATVSTAGTHEGLYLEGSVRTGNADMSFDSNDLTDAEGVRGRYNSKSKYYGAHGSVGYVLELDKKQSLDVYSRYTWTKQEGDKVSIGKDKLNLNASESSRLRLGARYSYAYTPRIKPYVGTAYEHEFKGDVSGSAYDLSIEKPSLSGNTGIFEVGVSMNPLASNEALSIDLGLQGYVGDREGGAATIKAKYAF